MSARTGGGVRASREGLCAVGGLLAALGALALLPWPGVVTMRSGGSFWLIWAALEVAFLLPLLPGLLASSPTVGRATAREAQLATAGRALLWLALGACEALGTNWQPMLLPARALSLAAVLLALPAATGWGPFGALPGWPEGGSDVALDAVTARLVSLARRVCRAVLLLTALILALPLNLPPLAMLVILVVVGALVLLAARFLRGVWPRFSLPVALQVSVLRSLPLSITAIIYAAIVNSL